MKYLTTAEAMARLGVTKSMVQKLIRGNAKRKGWDMRGAKLVHYHAFRVWEIPEGLVTDYARETGRA